MKNLMIFHAGTGTYFGLNDSDVYVIDLDKMTDEMHTELDETGEVPAEAIDSDACIPFSEFVGERNDLTYGNTVAYSPSAIRTEIRESLWENYSFTDEDRKTLEWALSASDDDLNEVASCILQNDNVWQDYVTLLMDGLREGYSWSKEGK